MPIQVKLFWWLSIGITVVWTFMTIWHFALPPLDHLAMLHRLSPEMQQRAKHIELLTGISNTAFWCVLTLVLAWIAVFRHSNWARWAFVVIFVVREAIPLAIYSAYGHPEVFIRGLRNTLADPWFYPIPMLTIAAIIAIFSRGAQDWFTVRAS